jgi:hypothetical protein
MIREYATRAVCIKKYQYDDTVFDVLQIYKVEIGTGFNKEGNSVLCFDRKGNEYGWFCVGKKDQEDEMHPVFKEHFRILE